jgi:hypothetical protein
MSPSHSRLPRRRSVALAAAAVGLLGVVPGVGLTHASAQQHGHGGCPAAESLVPGTTFHNHRLARGVKMSVGTAKDAKGTVNIHVLRVDLTRKAISVTPLMRSIGERMNLSTLARHHRRLVAATNTGYFDFVSGAPTDPLIVGGRPLVMSKAHQRVVGIGADGRLESGNVWLSSSLTAHATTEPVDALNETYPPSGIGVYSPRWGSASVPGHWNVETKAVTRGAVSSAARSGQTVTLPNRGYLLQARGIPATTVLLSTHIGTKVSVRTKVKTDAREPFVQAYGVGVQIVKRAGHALSGFSCNSSQTKTPARTAIGWTNGGRTMVIALVADHPHTSMHGLDEDQMSKLMVQLGVSQAYAFDGSGSTELLAKTRGSSGLKLQTYPADGQERPMPVGLGISVRPTKRQHKHH